MRPYLVLVRDHEVPVNEHTACETIDRLTQGTHGGGPKFVFLPQEGEVLRRTLRGRLFCQEDLEQIEQELRGMDPLKRRRRGIWTRNRLEEYVQEVRKASFGQGIDRSLMTLLCHLHDVERETEKSCRRSLLRAALVVFLATHTITTNTNNRTLRLTG